ncbi:MAG: hypothetical protein FWG12_07020 [Holophagaceae bacterium]|nr:hypothetical protein [Holophagaceae bacterium]
MHESGTVNHAYPFNIQSSNATGFAITTTSTQPAASAFSSANPTFKPTSEGAYTLYGWANNSTGINANPAVTQFKAAKDNPPHLPGSLSTASLNVNTDSSDPATVTFGDSAPDGHPVTWTGAAKPAGFPGEWSFANGVLTITADEDIEEADYIKDGEAIKFPSTATYVETYLGQQVSTATYNFTVSFSANASDKVGGSGSGSTVVDPTGYNAAIDALPTADSDRTAVVGIPYVYKTSATLRAPTGANTGSIAGDWATFNWIHAPVGLGNWSTLKNDPDYRHSHSWMLNGGFESRPTGDELGPRFHAWANHHQNTANIWQAGTLLFAPTKDYLTHNADGTVVLNGKLPRDIHIGVAALFDNPPIIGQAGFQMLKVTPNTPPDVVTTLRTNNRIDIKVANNDKWDGQYDKESIVVLRADESLFPGSFDLGAKISFFASATDIDRDDVLTAYLRGVYSSDVKDNFTGALTATGTALSSHNTAIADANITSLFKGQGYFDATTEALFESTSSIPWTVSSKAGETGFNGVINFAKVPTTGTIVWGEDNEYILGDTVKNAYFVFEVEDMGTNKKYFTVEVPFRANVAPVLDAYDPEDEGWEMTSGDDRKAWITGVAAQNSPTIWTIKWNEVADEPAKKRIADPLASQFQDKADPVFLEIRNLPRTDANMYVSPNSELVAPGDTWEIGWNKPTEVDARKEYSYTIGGWDKYGAATIEYEMKGLVWGSIYGEPVQKNIYLSEYVAPPAGSASTDKGTIATGIQSRFADFSNNSGNEGWARIKVDFFYGHNAFKGRFYEKDEDQELFNTFTSDLNQPVITRGGGKDETIIQDERWSTTDLPPVSYLISADFVDGSDQPVDVPVVGPPVLNTSMYMLGVDADWYDDTKPGVSGYELEADWPYAWPGGNLAPFAWLTRDSHTPDLSASVGSGIMAGYWDTSLGNYLTNYNNETLSSKYVGDLINTTGLPTYYGFDIAKFGLKDIREDLADPEYLSYWKQFTGTGATLRGNYNPLRAITNVNTTYTGVMNRVFSGVSLDDDTTAIQFSYPTIGQNAFFALSTAPVAANSYPAAVYPETDAWKAQLGKAKEQYTIDASGLGINRITFDVKDVLPWQATDGDPLTLSTMVKHTNSASGDAGVNNYPYWRMASTGVTWTGDKHQELVDASGIALASTNWYPVDNESESFTLSINRLRYMVNHRYALPRAAASGDFNTTASDTFRVVAYVNGTELGPDDNIHGMPVYLELGNINGQATGDNAVLTPTSTSGTTTWSSGTRGRNYNFGTFPIAKPDPLYWDAGGTTPVAIYQYNYRDNGTGRSGISGSAGYIAEVLPGNLAIAPISTTDTAATGIISQLRITSTADRKITPTAEATKALRALPTVRTTSNASTYAESKAKDATEYIISTNPFGDSGTLTPGQGNIPASTVVAHMHPEFIGGQPKVWLFWTNPAESTYSGHIFEFFTTTAGAVSVDDLPAYKVYMGKGQTEFPIPDSWLSTLGGTADEHVVIRVRTVRYGTAEQGNLVDFNQTPFLKAMPAQWVDVLSTRIDFTDAYAEQTQRPKFLAPGWQDGLSYIYWTSPVTAYLPQFTGTAGSLYTATPSQAVAYANLVHTKVAGGFVPGYDIVDYQGWTTKTSNEKDNVTVGFAGPAANTNPITETKINITKALVPAVANLVDKKVVAISGNPKVGGKDSKDETPVKLTINFTDITPSDVLRLRYSSSPVAWYSGTTINNLTLDPVSGLSPLTDVLDTWDKIEINGKDVGTTPVGDGLYSLVWTVTDASTEVGNAAAVHAAVFGTTDPFETIDPTTAPTFDFSDLKWADGDTVTFTVALKSPYADDLTSRPMTFKITMVDERDGKVFGTDTKVIVPPVTMSVPQLLVGSLEVHDPVLTVDKLSTVPVGLENDIRPDSFEWGPSRLSSLGQALDLTEDIIVTSENEVTPKIQLDINGSAIYVNGDKLELISDVIGHTPGDFPATSLGGATVIITLEDLNSKTELGDLTDPEDVDLVLSIDCDSTLRTEDITHSGEPIAWANSTGPEGLGMVAGELLDGGLDKYYTYLWERNNETFAITGNESGGLHGLIDIPMPEITIAASNTVQDGDTFTLTLYLVHKQTGFKLEVGKYTVTVDDTQ